MTIKEIFKQLTQVQRDALMVAFESHSSYFIEYVPGRFVGVYTDALRNLNCDQQSGEFREGEISDGQANHNSSI